MVCLAAVTKLLGPLHGIPMLIKDNIMSAGGMGEVYRARDTKLNWDVALKVLAGAVRQQAMSLAAGSKHAVTQLGLDSAQKDSSVILNVVGLGPAKTEATEFSQSTPIFGQSLAIDIPRPVIL